MFLGHALFTYNYESDLVYCYYGLKALLVISTSDDNPSRRFFGCSNYAIFGSTEPQFHSAPFLLVSHVILFG